MYTIIAENAAKADELRRTFARSDRMCAADIRAARKASGGARYVVIDAGFPRDLWLVWDCEAKDNLRGVELDAKNPPRHPWFVSKDRAQRIADARNRAEV